MRLPKRKGFKRHFKLVENVAVVNLSALNKDDRITKNVTKKLLKEYGYIRSETAAVKVLGNGDRSKAATFDGLEYFSKSALEKISKAWGKVAGSQVTKSDKAAHAEDTTQSAAE